MDSNLGKTVENLAENEYQSFEEFIAQLIFENIGLNAVEVGVESISVERLTFAL